MSSRIIIAYAIDQSDLTSYIYIISCVKLLPTGGVASTIEMLYPHKKQPNIHSWLATQVSD